MTSIQNLDSEEAFDLQGDYEMKPSWLETQSEMDDSTEEVEYPQLSKRFVLGNLMGATLLMVISGYQIGNISLDFLPPFAYALITWMLIGFASNRTKYPTAKHHFSKLKENFQDGWQEESGVVSVRRLSRKNIVMSWALAAAVGIFTIKELGSLFVP